MKMISTVCRSALLAAVLLLTALLPASRAEKDAVLTAYFPNWSIYSDDACQVGNLPWDRLDCINHAFWKIVPSG